MAKTFRVAILGSQDEAEVRYLGYKYGVEVFELRADQICNLLEDTDIRQSVQTTHSDTFPTPVMTYNVLVGGRFFPGVSREELFKAVQGIEILIARIDNSNYSSFLAQDFFEIVLTENILDTCQVFIARIVGPKLTYVSGRSRHRKTSSYLKDCGIDIQKSKYKGKFFIITDKSKTERNDKKRSKGNKISVERVRAELGSEELRLRLTQPVKETVTAGKAFANLGVRIGRWFSSLIKTH